MTLKTAIKTTLATAAVAALAAQPALADTTRSEAAGVGGGALIGALAGGPVGFIIGAAVGGHYGSTLEDARRVPGLDEALTETTATARRQSDEIDALASELDRRNGELTDLNRDLDALEQERAALMALRLDLLYTTDSAELSDSAARQVAVLASVLARMPGTMISLEGHADGRGASAYNEALGLERAETVRDALVAGGIDPERIRVTSVGEAASTATEGDLDAYALERRVSVRLGSTPNHGEPAVASSR